MTIQEIIEILENKLRTLINGRAGAVAGGNLEAVIRYDQDISSTTETLDQIKTLV
jgi:hypothetical protein